MGAGAGVLAAAQQPDLVSRPRAGRPRRWLRLEAAAVLAGADRLLGYGLKYDDNFQHTHLGQLDRPGGAG